LAKSVMISDAGKILKFINTPLLLILINREIVFLKHLK